jgi:hypothetical protein
MDHRYSTQVASDVARDGLGVELVDEKGSVVAEVFRSDRDRTVIVSTFNYDIPLKEMERLISHAKERLDPFIDGAALDSALTVAPRRAGD